MNFEKLNGELSLLKKSLINISLFINIKNFDNNKNRKKYWKYLLINNVLVDLGQMINNFFAKYKILNYFSLILI